MNTSDIVEQMIIDANFLEVTDIHFLPNKKTVKIYYRIMSDLIYQKDVSMQEYEKILRYIKFKSRLDIAKTKDFQDGSFIINNKKKYFVRISTLPLLESESLVIRILNENINLKIEDMSYIKDDINNILNVINNQVGLFIFTGPTGSGKTTTMYSILNNIVNDKYKKVITIENPIEIINENFVQVQIDQNLNIDYSKALKSALRQDPDIIMIGEIRDEATARNVFRAALTGHTVISTMHTKNLYGIIQRFLDFGFLKSEIESVLIGVCNQRLISVDNEIKSIYNYAINEGLIKLLKEGKESESIETKIKKIKNKNTFAKKT